MDTLCDDIKGLVCKNLSLEDYMKFKLTHKRIKCFNEIVEFETQIIKFDEEKIKRIKTKYPKTKFCIQVDNEDVEYFDNFVKKEKINVHFLKINNCDNEKLKFVKNYKNLDLSKCPQHGNPKNTYNYI